ncbi:hypothetical protein ACFTUC_09865 [Streptomyces sp. NPDC056944]|uniref:hypothetical protein n=1 Tax=Streptomyces sp. NPDC056944 TaxID=3345972 RepID=UPI00363588E4
MAGKTVGGRKTSRLDIQVQVLHKGPTAALGPDDIPIPPAVEASVRHRTAR